jgi:hypothetical protein
MRAHFGPINRTHALLGLLTALATMVVLLLTFTSAFRPRHPGPFSEPGAYGVGHGRETIMFGATARKGAMSGRTQERLLR